MGMFLNYQNIADNYTPNNIVSSFPVGKSYTKLDPVQASKPYEELNSKGELIGYFWYYGETLNLEFNIDGEIVVEDDALILRSGGQEPSETEGKLGQRAYNIVDRRSWTCRGTHAGRVLWTEDPEFIYQNQGTPVYVPSEEYLKNKYVQFCLYNFRREPIYSVTFQGKPKVIVGIDKELSKKLLRGIYYCSLSVFDDEVNFSIFDNNDCVLLVK